jgi:hypothetical protein
MEDFFADIGGAVMKDDALKIEIMRAVYDRAKLAAGCPTGDPFEMTEEERMNLRPAPDFVWRAATEIVGEHRDKTSKRDKRIIEILSRYALE